MNEKELYKQYVDSIMGSWMGIHLGPSIEQIIDFLYENGYIIDRLVTGTTGVAHDYSIFKKVTGYCSDSEDNKYKFEAGMHRDATQYHNDVWLLDDELELIPIGGY